MSKKFNLLLLHQPEDIHPRTWICLKKPELKTILEDLERDILKNQGWCREKLSREIANQLNCSYGTIKWILQRKREFYPIPILLELLKFNKNKEEILKEIKKNIKYLKVNSASAKPVRAVYKLNENLAKILGAFMADGSLSIQIAIAASQLKDLEKMKSKLTKLRIRYSTGYAPSRNQHYINIQANKNNFKPLNKAMHSSRFLTQTHYSIELTDEYKDNVEAFIRWIKEEFNINPNSFKKRRNAWRLTFSNKILARYLMSFFEVKPGPKAYSAFEPRIIKKSNLKTRKAFAKGVLMFDGCVTVGKKIEFGTVSRNLFTSINQIWEKDNIKFGKSISKRRGSYNPRKSYTLFTLSTTSGNKKKKLLKYFEPDTQKWKLLNWLSGDLTQVPIIKEKHSLSLEKVVKVLQKVKICDAIFLKNYFKCAHTTIRTYLKILKNQGKIRLSNRPHYISDYVNRNATVLLKDGVHNFIFKKIRERFKKDKNFAIFLGIHKATFSNWRLKKSRTPIYILRKMCEILNIDFHKVSRNIITVDQEIAEIT
ncbi:MAG: hypothetical protein COS25_02470 [Candidatus Nealsonbacteria bacterium CG02_land_8_20_14_3_00_37_10]|uniref:DOD-type homing endonuclease domain-containing protein n=1 Tax=Candidatus Nealsonbacteria bacterium CG02_land_8_20_14_3_00_37_10 TaxID=1974699 RepID=A0A2M7D8Y8_9BACT|nr:MAG: hypothetical protein COS25_02470 [Candidatus Nealsonbacteria bacterium CG02_land_8_20_14_3_00_37_10]